MVDLTAFVVAASTFGETPGRTKGEDEEEEEEDDEEEEEEDDEEEEEVEEQEIDMAQEEEEEEDEEEEKDMAHEEEEEEEEEENADEEADEEREAVLLVCAGYFLFTIFQASDPGIRHAILYKTFVYYNPLVVVVIVLWLWGINLYVFANSRVSYSKIFEFDHGHLTHGDIWKIAGWLSTLLAVCAACCMYLLFVGDGDLAALQTMISYAAIPFVLAFPIDAFHLSSRHFFLKTLVRICLPFQAISFSDFFIADVMTSMARVFSEMDRALCWMTTSAIRDKVNPDEDAVQLCSDQTRLIPFFILALPYACRFFQCIRQYTDTGDKSCLFNALKYATSFPVIFLSAMKYHASPTYWHIFEVAWVMSSIFNSSYSFYWDVARDWDFGCISGRTPLLRRNLYYSARWTYYWVILSDLVLRGTWTYKLSAHLGDYHFIGHLGGKELMKFVVALLEVFRRWQWIFFRVECEWNRINNKLGGANGSAKESKDISESSDMCSVGGSACLLPAAVMSAARIARWDGRRRDGWQDGMEGWMARCDGRRRKTEEEEGGGRRWRKEEEEEGGRRRRKKKEEGGGARRRKKKDEGGEGRRDGWRDVMEEGGRRKRKKEEEDGGRRRREKKKEGGGRTRKKKEEGGEGRRDGWRDGMVGWIARWDGGMDGEIGGGGGEGEGGGGGGGGRQERRTRRRYGGRGRGGVGRAGGEEEEEEEEEEEAVRMMKGRSKPVILTGRWRQLLPRRATRQHNSTATLQHGAALRSTSQWHSVPRRWSWSDGATGAPSDDAVGEFLRRYPLSFIFRAFEHSSDVPGLESAACAALERIFNAPLGASMLPSAMPYAAAGLKAPSTSVRKLACSQEYMSKKMPSKKLAKSTYERELYALYKALVHWRHFLLGRFFYLRTDHQTLKWIKTQPALSDALKRWIEVIDQYDFKLEYLKGEYNKVADALSRRADYLGALVSDFGVSNEVTQSLVGAYQEDPVTMDIIRKLQAKDKATKSEFVMVDGLIHLDKAGVKRLLVPCSEHLRSLFLGECHDATGHFGYKKTSANLVQRFWWPRMLDDAKKYLETCQVCTRDKLRTQAPLGLLKPLPILDGPGLSVSMDFMDTLVTSKSGKRHIFIIIDRFTKYARLVPMPETTRTEYVIKLFKDNWVRDFGLPKTIISDRDVRFTSELWKKTAGQMGSQLQMTSGNHLEANGQAEQMNRVVQHLLRHYIKPSQDDWDEHLPLIASLYNNAIHSSTGVSPNQLHFGWKPRSALNFLLPENRPAATPGTLEYGVQYEKLLQDLNTVCNMRNCCKRLLNI
ncbi:hypothetical protein CBR_g2888 [Chara braunii]|uniref:Integrase catalytic domain-containing protein n=1 Tax=Chara braunii TaxID=69332 RepID=A0A388KE61_CHABU|nr:hypothetical protein CBR_g2888 [Chara braunii]|eukprot:GBG68344.1 hypothetical protein CBR_g2888 [Chara braunii]